MIYLWLGILSNCENLIYEQFQNSPTLPQFTNFAISLDKWSSFPPRSTRLIHSLSKNSHILLSNDRQYYGYFDASKQKWFGSYNMMNESTINDAQNTHILVNE